MDAKPQRPIRTVRVRGDENVPPAAQMAKTIHHRNKSSPALSSMLGGAGLKAAAKRTAFGDVSNTTNSTRPSKDDSTLTTKPASQASGKLAQIGQEKKSSAFLRPAQRPLSVSNLKGLLTGVANNIHVDSTARQASNDTAPPNQESNTRKILSRRATTFFKDVSLDTVTEVEAPSQKQILTTTSTAPSQIPLSKATASLVALSDGFPAIPDSRNDHKSTNLDSNLTTANDIIFQASTVSTEVRSSVEVQPDGVYVNERSNTYVLQKAVPSNPEYLRPFAVKPVELVGPVLDKPDAHAMPGQRLPGPPQIIPSTLPHCPPPPPTADVEEYWDEEEEENFDEEGFVTARSYRSKGDSTTGGVTTVLFPQVNQKVKRELAAAKELVEANLTPEEIEDESFDTSMVAEYGDEIFDYMKQLEVKMLPNAHYMDNQHEIQWSMRAVLMDWLVQVHHRFNLLPETLFLCVNYIDRFLSCKIVSLGKLQLVGATAIFIAAKYEEINCPSVQEVVYMVDGGYTVDEILKAERFMLTMLQFELGWPGPMSFLRRISKADDYDLETRTLAKYFLEVTIMDERFIGSPPSFTAAGAHCLARMMLHKGHWSPQHAFYSNYTYSQLVPLLHLMVECCEDPRKHHSAVYNKYCDKRYKRASAFVENEMQKGFRLPTVAKELIAPNMVDYFDASSWHRMGM